MSDDLEERVRKAAQRHATRTDLNGRAKKTEDDNRADFLVRFRDQSRNVAMPAMADMKSLVEGPGKVQVQIDQLEDENVLAFELIDGKKRSILSFVADPVLSRVRVTYVLQMEMGDVGDTLRWREARRGAGEAQVRATLEDMTAHDVKSYVAELIERAIG
jgi:hypothetical protein